MHAVAVKVTIEDFEAARKNLRAQVVPAVSQAPGFVARLLDGIRGREQRFRDDLVRVRGVGSHRGRNDRRWSP
jgi:hypothetical protein